MIIRHYLYYVYRVDRYSTKLKVICLRTACSCMCEDHDVSLSIEAPLYK